MTHSVIKYCKKRSPSKKKTNEVTVYLVPTNNKVIGKCLTDIRNHGHYIQCGTSESKKLCSVQLDEESSYINRGLGYISRPESSEMFQYSPCKVIFENEALQTPSILSIPELVSILKPDSSYVVTDKKELNKRMLAINDGSECCMHIIDLPDLVTVVVHNTSSSSRSAGYVASSSFFTDQRDSTLDGSRRLKMRRMLLKQQELTLAKVEEVKKNKSLKKYVSDVTEVFMAEMRKLRNRMANLNWLS